MSDTREVNFDGLVGPTHNYAGLSHGNVASMSHQAAVSNPREAALPNAGLIVVRDAETGEQLYVDTSNPVFRQRFQAAAERREVALKADLKRAGLDLFAISTEEDLTGAILRMAAMRKKRRMRGGPGNWS